MGAAYNKKAQPTVDEIIALLKKTDLPTVICEGSVDLIVYRRLEDTLSHMELSILPAGGRENVLKIFDRRSEIPSSVKLAFIADLDIWVNSVVPPSYLDSALCLTTGYSIENDVFIDGNLERLLVGTDLHKYKLELDDFLDWYALALSRHMTNQSEPISLHPDHVLKPSERSNLLALRAGEIYPKSIRASLSSDYRKLVRGKSLLSLLIRNTNSRKGLPTHTDKGLLEIVASSPGTLLITLTAKVETALAVGG